MSHPLTNTYHRWQNNHCFLWQDLVLACVCVKLPHISKQSNMSAHPPLRAEVALEVQTKSNTTCNNIVHNQALVGVQVSTNLQKTIVTPWLSGSLVCSFFFLTMLQRVIKFHSSAFPFLPYLERFAHIFITRLKICQNWHFGQFSVLSEQLFTESYIRFHFRD